MKFTIPNKLISIKKMQRMTKDDLCKKIKEVDPSEKVQPWNYTHTVLMDILNYNLNQREAKEIDR